MTMRMRKRGRDGGVRTVADTLYPCRCSTKSSKVSRSKILILRTPPSEIEPRCFSPVNQRLTVSAEIAR